MTEADGAGLESQCCGGHGHDHAAQGGLCAQDAACGGHAESCGGHAESCGGHAESCGAEGEACCGGHGHGVDDMFAFPVTAEVVSVPAVTLAGILDLVEKLAPDVASLATEVDYQEGQRLLADQAPELVALRDAFLERMKALLNEVAGQTSDH